MKLIMHNFLACNIKGVKNGYPLAVEANKVEIRDADFDPGLSLWAVMPCAAGGHGACANALLQWHADFIRNIMERVDYGVLRKAAVQLGLNIQLPVRLDMDRLQNDDDDILQQLHHALLEAHVDEGTLVCPESGRKFPISKGIVNMLLHADEV